MAVTWTRDFSLKALGKLSDAACSHELEDENFPSSARSLVARMDYLCLTFTRNVEVCDYLGTV